MIVEGEHYFCCNGCQGVFHLLSESGLDGFYEKAANTKLTPQTAQYEDAANFDAPAFYERFVTTNSEGFEEVSLVIEGIHCAACVWLNEKALHKMDGVIEAHINYTNNKARITWADSVVKLSGIIEMIRAIGYNAFPYDPSTQELSANKQRKDYYLRMAVATFASMNIMWIAVAQYAGYFTGITQDVKTILNVAEWILATPVLFYSGWIFFRGAYYGIKNRVVNMDILVATGAFLTYIYSIYITLAQEGEAYFDSVAMIITFVLFGKFLEVLSKKSAADTLDIISRHVPSEVSVIQDGNVVTCNVNEVEVGSIVLLKAGEKVALDGVVYEGEGSIDESSLTGESHPIYKKVGDPLVSGTTSIDALLQYKTTKDFAHSTIANLVSLLEKSMAKKPKIEQMANRLSEHFSTAILLLACLTFVVWWFGPHSFETAFMVGISVIVIACPCALALATPVATLVGLGLGARRGILFKEAAQLETMAKSDILVLDKTGTITKGSPEVLNVTLIKPFDQQLLFSLLSSSNHPIATGVARALECESVLSLDALKQLHARGIYATYKDQELLGGNARLMREYGIDVDFVSEHSLFFFAVDGVVHAIYELSDVAKEDSATAIKSIQKRGIEVVMLTGDHEGSANKIAKDVGILHVKHSLTPEEKAAYIAQAQDRGKVVVMAGDGVNDILALANANIGIAMGSGSDIAIDVSDVVLLGDNLTALSDAFGISKTTYRLIRQNLGISLVYNAITIPLAMAGYIIPLIAAISMSVSSLLVVGNSMRIRWSVK
jgi:Cu+-exporting ATPase